MALTIIEVEQKATPVLVIHLPPPFSLILRYYLVDSEDKHIKRHTKREHMEGIWRAHLELPHCIAHGVMH